MKKSNAFVCGAALMLCACGGLGTTSGTTSSASSSTGSILGTILGAATNGNTISNLIYDVIGLDKLSKEKLIGTWKYRQPGCAFTTEQLLAKAGGEVAATTVRQKLEPYYQQIGINSSNTYFTFNEDNTFSGKLDGKSLAGKYTFNKEDQTIELSMLLFSTKCHVNRNAHGISLLFESKKLLTALQFAATISGNSSLQTIGDFSKNYEGVRIGFDLSK
ncbi:MAG: DUF4923 family protein [Prevotella sp.]|nr:DUF4923 family protein [Prevotella sp.]